MKNHQLYPDQKWPQNKEEFFEFWKDCPLIHDDNIPEVARWQWCIIMYQRWWIGSKPKEYYYRWHMSYIPYDEDE